ncbi:TPA: hypothetical protein HA244_06090 [Candidatus Micrarchaeota archaeon]|nr:hypothetical protein [Candidatus Micrarchaeota archaeon]
MRILYLLAIASFALLAGCVSQPLQQPLPSPTAAPTIIPTALPSASIFPTPVPSITPTLSPSPSDIYYCIQDSDCVRQETCCSCGLGVYINKAYQRSVDCSRAGACLCPIQNSIGKCIENKCSAVAVNPQ